MKIEKFAAIDIGSNAIRLLIANVVIKKKFSNKIYQKLNRESPYKAWRGVIYNW